MIGELGITTYGREAATYLNYDIKNKWVTIGQLTGNYYYTRPRSGHLLESGQFASINNGSFLGNYSHEAAVFLNWCNWY